MTLGKLIRAKRKAKKLTQKELQKIVHINFVTLSDFEQGKSRPSLKNMKKLANVLEISESEYIQFFEPIEMSEIQKMIDELATIKAEPSMLRMLNVVVKEVLYQAKKLDRSTGGENS